jgi:hypothetical protein
MKDVLTSTIFIISMTAILMISGLFIMAEIDYWTVINATKDM